MTKFLRLVFAVIVATTLHTTAVSQSLSVNTDGSTANPSALLDVKSTSKGVLVPRMSKTERNAIATPATGLMVFQNAPDSIGFYYYNGTSWLWLATANTSVGWLTTGNAGTDTTINFLGTLDNKPLMLRQNNTWMGQLNNRTANYFIGDSSGIKTTTGTSNVAFGSKSSFENTAGYGNVAIGNHALQNNTSGSRNTVIGDSALYTQSFNAGANFQTDNTVIGNKAMFYTQPANGSTGIKNVAVGNEAMYLNTTGVENTAIGVSALRENTIGNQNTAVGRSAHRLSGSGSANSYFGYVAGLSDSLGSANTGLGAYSLYSHQRNSANVAVGYAAMYLDSSGANNSSLGSFSMYNNKSGNNNTAIGASSMFSAKTGSANVAIGHSAMWSNDSSHYNTAIGYTAMYKHQRIGNTYNTAVGSYSMEQDSLGYYNTGVGTSTFRFNVTGVQNTGVGINAGYYQKESNNTFVGAFAGAGERAPGSNFAADTGYNNTAVGSYSLNRLASGVENTAVGYAALTNDSSGHYNTAIGTRTLYGNLRGSYNVAVGQNAMFTNEASDFNTAVGWQTLYKHKRVGFTYNTAVGSNALEQDSTGNQNTGIGVSTFRMNVTGIFNTGVGINAGYNQKESYNTFIGAYSGVGERSPYNNYAADTGNYNTGLGYFSLYRIANGSNNLALGYNTLVNDSSGNNNTAVGAGALNLTTADGNTALGYASGSNNITGTFNTLAGYNAEVSASNLINASAIGARSLVAQSNSMVLGSINGTNGATADTKVGIGTTAPDSTFSIADKFMVGSSGTAQFDNSVPTMMYMFRSGASNADRMVIAHSPTSPTYGLEYQDLTDQFNFLGAGNPRLSIELGTGQVGIGTAAPTKKLHIFSGTSGATTSASSGLLLEDNATNYIELATPDANESGIISSNTGGIRGGLIFTLGEGIQFRAGGNINRVSILNNGDMGIGTIAPIHQLQLTTDDAAKPGSTTWIIVSDERLKTINGNYTRGLSDILKLNTIRYNYIKENTQNLPSDQQFYGFSAQDVQKVFPEAVKTGKDGYLNFNMHPILVSYVNAFKEQQQQINELRKQNELLMKRVEKLENK